MKSIIALIAILILPLSAQRRIWEITFPQHEALAFSSDAYYKADPAGNAAMVHRQRSASEMYGWGPIIKEVLYMIKPNGAIAQLDITDKGDMSVYYTNRNKALLQSYPDGIIYMAVNTKGGIVLTKLAETTGSLETEKKEVQGLDAPNPALPYYAITTQTKGGTVTSNYGYGTNTQIGTFTTKVSLWKAF